MDLTFDAIERFSIIVVIIWATNLQINFKIVHNTAHFYTSFNKKVHTLLHYNTIT